MAESGGKRKTHKSKADEAPVLSDSDNPWWGLPYDPVTDPEMERKTKLRRQWADFAAGIADRLESDAVKEAHARRSVPAASYDNLIKARTGEAQDACR